MLGLKLNHGATDNKLLQEVWTHTDKYTWRHMALLGHNELRVGIYIYFFKGGFPSQRPVMRVLMFRCYHHEEAVEYTS